MHACPLLAFLRPNGPDRPARPGSRPPCAVPRPRAWPITLALAAGLAAGIAPAAAHDDIICGTGATALTFPLRTSSYAARVQAIYRASEINTGGTITALALYVSTVPGGTLNNWEIRLKHTAASEFAAIAWEDTGLQTVYLHNETVPSTGWCWFTLDTPFAYNGTDSLLVDFGWRNTATSTTGRCHWTNQGTTRALTAFASSEGGALSPPSGNTSRPNLRLTMGPSVTGIDPSSAANTGPVSATLAGAHFEAGATAKLVGTEGYVNGKDVQVASSSQITCTFPITGAPPGIYDIVVTNTDGLSGTLAGGLVITGDGGLLPVELQDVRATRARSGKVVVEWSAAAGVDVAGYHVLRAARRAGPFVRVTRRLVAAGRRVYRFVDAGARRRSGYFYRLDTIFTTGRSRPSPVIAAPLSRSSRPR